MMLQRRNILAGLAASIALASQQVGAQMLPPPTGLPAGSVEPIGSHVVSYIEVEPGSEDKAVAIVRAMRTASLKDAGIKSFVILQRINSPHHFSVLEEWADNAARQAHLTQPQLTATREQLAPLLTGPYDERPHRPLATGPAKPFPNDAMVAITHVDFVPTYREEGEKMLGMLAEASRAEPGAARFDVLTQASRPNHMTLVEVWQSSDAWRKHVISKHARDFRHSLLPRSGSVYDERLYRMLD